MRNCNNEALALTLESNGDDYVVYYKKSKSMNSAVSALGFYFAAYSLILDIIQRGSKDDSLRSDLSRIARKHTKITEIVVAGRK